MLADDTVSSADVELSLTGHIAGVVTDLDGAPLKGIYLRAHPRRGRTGDLGGNRQTRPTVNRLRVR